MPPGVPYLLADAEKPAKMFLAMAPEAKSLGPDVAGMMAKLLAKHQTWLVSSQTADTNPPAAAITYPR